MKLAAVVGVEPWKFTLRELIDMATARNTSLWAPTASLMSLIANMMKSDGGEPYTAYDFNPYTEKPEPTEAEIAFDKQLLKAKIIAQYGESS